MIKQAPAASLMATVTRLRTKSTHRPCTPPNDAGVGRDETACRQQHQIAGYGAPGVDGVDTAVAYDLRADV